MARKRAPIELRLACLMAGLVIITVFHTQSAEVQRYNSEIARAGRRLMEEGGSEANASSEGQELSLMNLLDGPGCGANSTLKMGGIPIWLFGVLYMFLGLAIICDDFFVPTLDAISEALKLSEDVAGATFMAAGSSAPELFTSLIGSFFHSAGNNPGPGTIVGSAVFNITIIIGATILLTKETLKIFWWPLIRDCSYYAFSIIVFFLSFSVITPGRIDIWEAIFYVLAYFGYIVLMKFNSKVVDRLMMREIRKDRELVSELQGLKGEGQEKGGNGEGDDEEEGIEMESVDLIAAKEGAARSREKEIEEYYQKVKGLNPALRKVYRQGTLFEVREKRKDPPTPKRRPSFRGAVKAIIAVQKFSTVSLHDKEEEENNNEEENNEEVKEKKSACSKFVWAVSLPLSYLFKFTVPDVSKKRWKKFYLLAFFLSILWIGVLSFFMVDFANKAGECFGISATVMGLTVLAAGTSVPDALSSILVARDGKGDMAVSNAIGSNVFDIFLGLGLPWLIKTTYLPGNFMAVETGGIEIYVPILFGILFLFLGMIVFSKFHLKRAVGGILIALYALFVAFGLLDDLVITPAMHSGEGA
uniref:Sodium/calcium exchanger membrane region domain-containing protein n=1 Tax=Palpitomonas bilix TaxID=652834 RepID=A0A7S3DC54_9EUKA|mmetsp:Transcript_30608/g.79890  ORF Transcript_30608/g.79890 Transcript_30608/m.79890 type:complete len:587 (+) Transcript_30608:287-2047(+)|eukprot:CAMPEP_0113879406 /NCGR_PEP_ID=MMETSP0780_2-20120614/7223_1 /TAXON_ID=652834 /ORGANISM="Palpitomonas bilix" /LENGTH=586 /DNA_ID=CAMNT_0000865989 /DNA_START=32 /DNA_END=1792 /DNA_ORIENTATION=+ /assembly_acc=CAM_ASM_000599